MISRVLVASVILFCLGIMLLWLSCARHDKEEELRDFNIRTRIQTEERIRQLSEKLRQQQLKKEKTNDRHP